MPKWMADVDALEPGKTFGLGILLGAVNPKNLVLSLAAAAGLAQLGLAAGEVVVSIIVFVVLGSLTIAGPVAYYLFGGERAKTVLNDLKDWLGAHNAAVMTVLFLVFGVDLIAKGLPPLTT
jgi:threonine/homoserine/homoserine lactone efflux protein